MSVSDIQLVESASKSDKPGPLNKGGFNLVPHISDFYPQEEEKLIFYAEAYGHLSIWGKSKVSCQLLFRRHQRAKTRSVFRL
jgi:hypothetical protein